MKKKEYSKLIKTQCGLKKYDILKKNKSFYGKVRLKWFVFFAIIRDYFLKV